MSTSTKAYPPGFRLRWSRDPRPKGLASVAAGPSGYTLRDASGIRFATASCLRDARSDRWYWVAGWDAKAYGVPHENACDRPSPSAEAAKAAALAFVREKLAAPREAARRVAGEEQGRLLKLPAAAFSEAIAQYDAEERDRLSKLWADRVALLGLLEGAR